jgi:2-oxo-4-hydroxy-4-carboxy--5-ureidoimidazoline (OHCU) decarboxylase
VTAFDISELNAASEAAFREAIAPLFEGAPRFLARVAVERPFEDWPSLFDLTRAIARAMPEEEQIELVDAHPRLGAPPATVSALSFDEQGFHQDAAERAAGAPEAKEAEEAERGRVASELARLNAAYEARFGFRYCVFVAGRSRAALLPGMAAGLSADRETELHRALDAVVDIAIARLETLRVTGT